MGRRWDLKGKTTKKKTAQPSREGDLKAKVIRFALSRLERAESLDRSRNQEAVSDQEISKKKMRITDGGRNGRRGSGFSGQYRVGVLRRGGEERHQRREFGNNSCFDHKRGNGWVKRTKNEGESRRVSQTVVNGMA